jgi:hypothetical protein
MAKCVWGFEFFVCYSTLVASKVFKAPLVSLREIKGEREREG